MSASARFIKTGNELHCYYVVAKIKDRLLIMDTPIYILSSSLTTDTYTNCSLYNLIFFVNTIMIKCISIIYRYKSKGIDIKSNRVLINIL